MVQQSMGDLLTETPTQVRTEHTFTVPQMYGQITQAGPLRVAGLIS